MAGGLAHELPRELPPERALRVAGVQVDVVRKAIKHLHVGVYPPAGRVRVAAPLAVSDDAVRLAVVNRLAWIRRQQAQFAAQPRQGEREMVSGESHYVFGRRRRLRVIEHDARGVVDPRGRTVLELRVPRGADRDARARLLDRWYRAQLRVRIPPLLDRWQDALGVCAAAWGVRRMRTRWGSCNVAARRVWLNLELAKKPEPCLEYVVAHELAHLVERLHTDRFTALLDRHLPDWRHRRRMLNAEPLAHEVWGR